MIDSFKRDNTKVILSINSNLGTCQPIYPMSFNCGDQETAELLMRYLNKELEKYRTYIAQEAWGYLEDWQISKLKRDLQQWSIKEEDWK